MIDLVGGEGIPTGEDATGTVIIGDILTGIGKCVVVVVSNDW
jgi:hypothetical protein